MDSSSDLRSCVASRSEKLPMRYSLFRQQIMRESFPAMGTVVTVTIALSRASQRGMAAAAIAMLRQTMNDFGRDWWAWGNGALAGINRQLAAGEIAIIPATMQPLFVRAWEIAKLSRGLFEPRIGALVRLWGFDDTARLRTAPPAPSEISVLLDALSTAPDHDGGGSYGPAPGIAWDFGGIGKGHIVDLALDWLASEGFADATVDAGGNLAVRGARRDRPWHIGIRDPRGVSEVASLLATLEARDEAVNTHGDDQRFFEYAGRRYSHILDPRTGMPVQGLRSLTVVHADGCLAEAAGAALFVAGREGWPALAAELGIDQVMAVTGDGTVHATPRLAARLRPEPGVLLNPVTEFSAAPSLA